MLKKTMLCLMALGLFAGSVARAQDIKAEMDDLKAKVAALESASMAPAAGGDAESLTSLKKKGSIKIGGGVNMDVIVLNRDDGDSDGDGSPLFGGTRDSDDSVDSTSFLARDAYLNFVVQASKNSKLVIKLDLTDFWDEGTEDQDDLLEQCYYLWNDVMGAPVDILFGKSSVDFGMAKSIGITDSFTDGTGSYLSSAWEENDGNDNRHQAIGTNALGLGQPSDLFQIMAQYRYKEQLRVAVAVFQSNNTTGAGGLTRGMHEDRSDDTLLAQSFAGKVEYKPIENLTLEASFINVHSDSHGDGALAVTNGWVESANDATASTCATSLGFDYGLKAIKLDIWGEWQHVCDAQFDNDKESDIVSLGAIYSLNENIDLGLMGEWATIDSDRQNAGSYEDEDYYQVAVNATYKLPSGIFMTLEYAHLWYYADLNSREDVDRNVDMVGFRTGFEF